MMAHPRLSHQAAAAHCWVGRVALVMLLVAFMSPRALANGSAPWSHLVPKGFRLLQTIQGDLNRDGQDDLVLVVKASDPGAVVIDERGQRVDRNRRGLVIAFQGQEGYRLALKNPALFSSENEDGGVYFPPDLSVGIEKGVLALHYAHGRYGYREYKFRYQQQRFVLIGYDQSENHGPVIESFTSVNFSIGKKLKKTNVNRAGEPGDERFVEQWSQVMLPKLILLEDITDLEDGSVEKALRE